MGIYDIGIIGGGTAGMTAAIYGQRAGKQTVLFEGTTFGGQITFFSECRKLSGNCKCERQ